MQFNFRIGMGVALVLKYKRQTFSYEFIQIRIIPVYLHQRNEIGRFSLARLLPVHILCCMLIIWIISTLSNSEPVVPNAITVSIEVLLSDHYLSHDKIDEIYMKH